MMVPIMMTRGRRDLDAVADECARLNAGVYALKVEHGDGGVAVVIPTS